MNSVLLQPAARISLKGLARLSGYSYFTVSKVVNGHSGVSQKTRQRILEIAQKMNYRPNAAARSIYRNKTLHAGIMLRNAPDKPFHNPAALELIVGLNNALAGHGYLLSLIRIGDMAGNIENDSRVFREHALDGLIVSGGVSQDMIDEARKRIPCCLYIDSNVWQSHGCIQRDEYHAGYVLAKHLISQGYRELFWVGPELRNAVHYSLHQRFAGAHDAALESGVSWDSYFRPHRSTVSDHCLIPEATVRRFSRPETGIIAYGVGDALEWAGLAMSLGLVAGRDYAMASCEDMQSFAEHWPDLTRMDFNRLAMGQQAAEMFLQLLNNPSDPPVSRRVQSRLVPGRTARGLCDGNASEANVFPPDSLAGFMPSCETDMLCVCGK